MDINKFIDFKHKLPNPETYLESGRGISIDIMDKTIIDGKAVLVTTTYRVERDIKQDGCFYENKISQVKTEINYYWVPKGQNISQSFGSNWDYPDLNFKEGGVFGE